TNRLDIAVLLLFVIMLAWQMVHFYAIAIRRCEDYAAASLPVWPVKHGVAATKRQMLLFASLFVLVAPLPTFFGYAGWFYTTGVLALGTRWFWTVFAGQFVGDDKAWAKQTFLSSLVTLLAFSCLLAFGSILP